jgi:ribosomal protein S18 acetylase RimI-like enzyme
VSAEGDFRVRPARSTDLKAVGRLLVEVFVGEGYSSPDAAQRLEDVESLARSGQLLLAEGPEGELVGVVLLVTGGANARLAGSDEAEVRLLATRPGVRRRGVGGALMRGCVELAAQIGSCRLVLWTQPSMESARSLYEGFGFTRAPARDWTAPSGRQMLVYERDL